MPGPTRVVATMRLLVPLLLACGGCVLTVGPEGGVDVPPAAPASASASTRPPPPPIRAAAPPLRPPPWKAPDVARWRAAIEAYTPSVRPGNQLPLNASAKSWATFLVRMHERLHPAFADDFLTRVLALPASDPLSDVSLLTRIELVLDGEGAIVRMGVVRSSGQADFDAGALESLARTAPFGPVPPDVRSADGNVYVIWGFGRDPNLACSTINASPYLLK